MKIHQTKKIKVIAIVVLIFCTGLNRYITEINAVPFKYIWPMHLIIMALGIIMVFGMMNDQRIVEKEIGSRFDDFGIISRFRIKVLSSLVPMPILLISSLPAFVIMGNSIHAGLNNDQSELIFVKGWLLFTIVFTTYFLVAQPLMNYGFLKLANRTLKEAADKKDNTFNDA